MADKAKDKTIVSNRAAYHEYYIEDTLEAGISLSGTEVKSIRAGRVNLKDAFAYIKNGELFVANMHVSPYEQGNIFNKDPLRVRKLLVKKREIRKLQEASQREGYTLIPTDLHFSRDYVKLTLGVAKGKKLYDKRETSKKKEASMEAKRAIKARG